MLPESSPEIKFIGVGRIADHNLVATLAHNPDNKQESDALLQAALAVLNTPDFFRKVQPGAYHSLAAEVNVVHFTVDNDASRIYLIIASKEYPKRVVFELVSKLVQQFLAEFSIVSMTCPRNGLNSRAKPMFSALMDEFSDLSRKDNLFRVGQELKDMTHQLKHDNDDSQQMDIENQHSDHTSDAGDQHHGEISAHKKEKCRQYQTYGLIASVIFILVLLISTQLSSGQEPTTFAPTAL